MDVRQASSNDVKGGIVILYIIYVTALMVAVVVNLSSKNYPRRTD